MDISFSKESGLITYVIDGKITVADMIQLQQVRDQFPNSKALKILAIVTDFSGYENFGAMKTALLGDWNMLPRLSKYAIITDICWLRNIVLLLDRVILKSELKAFPFRDRKIAEKWLG